MRKSIVTLIVLPLALFVGKIFSAQGTITEVNPSGVHGKIIVTQAAPGEVVCPGDEVSFTYPAANYTVGGQATRIKKGTNVLFSAVVVGNSGQYMAVPGTMIVGPTQCPTINCQ